MLLINFSHPLTPAQRYQLTTRGGCGALRYGLEVVSERIVWEDAAP